LRFIENGPDIPDELLFAQDDGNVVFFCGAGVSMAYSRLSSFADLAEKVITDLGATEESKAKKLFSTFMELNKDPHTRGVMSADHIFSGLIRSFDRDDINCSVARSLLPKGNPDLAAHKIILNLARSQGGQTRLITTNFDLLFEASNQRLKSVTRSSLPHIEFADNDWGIVHLHGKVKKDYSGPDRDGFVLSSSEFGDAYLAQGWARNFVKDVLGKFVAVFIGYSADDPPIRYLLEGLQQSDAANHNIYAFQSADDEAVAQWDEKGVMPIVYDLDLDQKNTHAPLWNSLDAWGTRTKSTTAWKKRLISKARKGPTKLESHERGMVAHLIKSQSGARAFEQKNPPLPAEWLCVFDPAIRLQQVGERDYSYLQDDEVINPYQLYGIDSDPPPSDRNEEFSQEVKSEAWDAFALNHEDNESINNSHLPAIRNFRSNNPARLPPRLNYLASWIAKVSDQRIAVWWAGRQSAIHPDLLRYINTQLTRNTEKTIPQLILEAWNRIFELSTFYGREEYREYDLKHRIKALGWNNHFVREYAKISAPFLKSNNLSNRSIPRDNRKKLSKYSLVRLDVDYPKGVYDMNVSDEYLPQIANAMRINLEHAVEMEQDFSGWLRDICAIEPDDESDESNTSRAYHLSGYVLHFANLFRKLCKLNAQQAKLEFDRWRRNDPAFTRLRVWACGLEGFVDEETFTDEILSLSDADFWPFRGQRDLLISLRNKWNELSHDNRKLIEKRILKGPPKIRKEPKDEHVIRSAHNQLNRLHWLNKQGCKLSLDLEAITIKLRTKAPEWKPEYAEKAAESHDVRSGWVKTDTDWSNLSNVPLTKIIENAKKKKSRDYGEFTEYAPFAGLCDDMPLRAISALSIELKKGKFHPEFWEDYLSRETRKRDKYRLKLLAAGRITQIPNKDFKDILLTASRWFEDHGPELREKNPKMFQAVWDKFIETITAHENASGSALVRQEEKEIDWTGEAINSASGNLAELHKTDPAKENLKAGKGYPKQWLKKVDQLLGLPNDAHRYAMVIFAFNLSWFHYIDPKWTERKLIKIIEDDKASEDDKAAIWAGFMWGARIPNEELYIKLKPHLLKMARERAYERKRHVEVLSALLLSGWGSKDKKKKQYMSDEELRNVLLVSGDDLRSHTLWHLDRWSKDKKSKWDKKVLQFLQKAWPKHKKVRTSKTSARLCEIALKQEKNFPAVSKQVAQLVSKISNESVYIPQIRKAAQEEEEGDNLATDYPEEYLNLLYAILPDQPERWPYGAVDVLKHIEKVEPNLLNDPRLIELKSRLNDL
jgi:hypothetical protein